MRELLAQAGASEINRFDSEGRTPLMYAVSSADVETVRLLLAAGASVHQESRKSYESGNPVLALAVRAGDPEVVAALIEAGAPVQYERDTYDVLIDALFGRDVYRDARLIELLGLLVAHGACMDTVTSYDESVLRVLSRKGRFDAIQFLLEAGADESLLSWTPLIKAVALGTVADVEHEIAQGAELEGRDYWERTAWLVAIQCGDLEKARLLLEKGADRNAVGRCSQPSLFYTLPGHQVAMLRWLLSLGIDIEQTDEFGETPLMAAAEGSRVDVVELLLAHGATVDRRRSHDQTALSNCGRADIARVLLAAGADPRELNFSATRALLNLQPQSNEPLRNVTAEEFKAGHGRRFGTSNPEEIHEPFWHAMIRSGLNAYQGADRCSTLQVDILRPVWCAERYGQSLTTLPDGRNIQIGGEHEDHYDEDFCIYNDVFVHEPDGTIRIFGYPESVFPCTDFHTATLIGNEIWIIGALSYPDKRQFGTTPVFVLNTDTFQMRKVATRGEPPGWINRHRAILLVNEIRVSGGFISFRQGDEEKYEGHENAFVLDTRALVWRRD